MSLKTHKTALVLVPPPALWEPIQNIRRHRDPHVRRWMPHITLLYPFRPGALFDAVIPVLTEACQQLHPFAVTLARFHHFVHREGLFTLWLAPEPSGHVVRLHNELWRLFPDCDDVRRHPGKFTPHLSVGQVRSRPKLKKVIEALQASWEPLTFTVREVHLIVRGDPPHDIFRVAHKLPLGSSPSRAER